MTASRPTRRSRAGSQGGRPPSSYHHALPRCRAPKVTRHRANATGTSSSFEIEVAWPGRRPPATVAAAWRRPGSADKSRHRPAAAGPHAARSTGRGRPCRRGAQPHDPDRQAGLGPVGLKQRIGRASVTQPASCTNAHIRVTSLAAVLSSSRRCASLICSLASDRAGGPAAAGRAWRPIPSPRRGAGSRLPSAPHAAGCHRPGQRAGRHPEPSDRTRPTCVR